MAKKLKIFSQTCLAVVTALTLGYAATISPVNACGDGTGTNGTDGVATEKCISEAEGVELISPAPEKEDETYFAADASIESEKTLSHSFFLAGNEVVSKDLVDGINFVAGNLVEVEGSSEYAAVAGNSIKISGSVERDLFVAGNAVEILEDAYVGRDLYAFGNSLSISTNLFGNAFVGGNRLVLENVTIDGDFSAEFDEIVIKGKSSVSGTFSYNENAVVTGLENLSTGKTETFVATGSKISFARTLEDKLISLLGRIFLTIVLVTLASKFVKKLLETFCLKTSWKHLGLGLALLLVIPICSLFVMISVIGLPLGVFAMLFWAVFAYLGTSMTGGILGDILFSKLFKKPKANLLAKFVLGIAVIELLTLIPVVGGLISAVSTCFGFGYLTHRLFKRK